MELGFELITSQYESPIITTRPGFLHCQINLQSILINGWGPVGRVVTYVIWAPRFESFHRQFYRTFFPWTKIYEKKSGIPHFKISFYKNYVGLVCTSGHNTRVLMYYLLHWSFHTINFYVKLHCKNLYKTRNVLKWQTSSYDRTWISLELKMIFRIDRDKGYLDRPSLGVSQTMPILRQKF